MGSSFALLSSAGSSTICSSLWHAEPQPGTYFGGPTRKTESSVFVLRAL